MCIFLEDILIPIKCLKIKINYKRNVHLFLITNTVATHNKRLEI